jgi:hypothetical protein
MPTVSFDGIAKCDTQYASSGFGGILKREIEMESPHAVHVFFVLLRSVDGAEDANSVMASLTFWHRKLTFKF